MKLPSKVISNRQLNLRKPYAAGAIVQNILAFMRMDDYKWQYLSEWTVKKVLDDLSIDGSVWRTGKDSWDVIT